MIIFVIFYIQQLQMFKIICLLAMIVFGWAGMLQLREEIQNTQQLIYLYQQKLRILKDIYQKSYPDIPSQSTWIARERRNITIRSKTSPQLALINKLDYSSLFFQNRYLLSSNQVIDVSTQEIKAEFMGDVLIVEDSLITTLVGGKINMVTFRQQAGKVKSQEYFLGLSGDKLDSIWHRNYNIKDGQDLLIQWQQNKIYFRGKEVNLITMPSEESIIAIYSLNQYKVIFVSTHRIGIINSRSLQVGQFEHARNITKIKPNSSEDIRIIQSYRQDGFIIMLLSTGELAKYYNQKIVNIQLLPGLSQHYNLYQNTFQLQYVHPYLFIANIDLPSIKIYLNQMNRFQDILYVNIESSKPTFSFFKQHDSYRVAISTANETKIYELLLPTVQQTAVGTNYFKFVGIFVVVVCFIYFKWFKKGDQAEFTERKQLARKYGPLDKGRGPEPGKQKNRLAQSEIEQFLKKQSREHHKKPN